MRVGTSDQARAYGAWARAAGDTVVANARPRAFARGVLTVECVSSIWAQELYYLGGQLLARMSELDPAHPVQRLRFVTRHSPAADGDKPVPPPDERPPAGPPSRPSPAVAAGPRPQDRGAAASKKSKRDGAARRADLDAARRDADGVGDETLRKAILAALGAAAVGPPQTSPDEPSVNHKK